MFCKWVWTWISQWADITNIHPFMFQSVSINVNVSLPLAERNLINYGPLLGESTSSDQKVTLEASPLSWMQTGREPGWWEGIVTHLLCLPASLCFPSEEATARSNNAYGSLLGFSVAKDLLGNNNMRCFCGPFWCWRSEEAGVGVERWAHPWRGGFIKSEEWLMNALATGLSSKRP